MYMHQYCSTVQNMAPIAISTFNLVHVAKAVMQLDIAIHII